jgi:hypothetical protein
MTNKTIALSATLISLSILLMGSLIVISLPDVEEVFQNLCVIILFVSFFGFIATLVALLKNA